MADIFRGLLVTELKKKPDIPVAPEENFLLLSTPTDYAVGSSFEWPTPPFIEREQPQLFGIPLVFHPVAGPPPPKASVLMGQGCL